MKVDQVATCITCIYCNKEFNNKSNFNRHQKNVHKRDAKGEHVEEIKTHAFTCPLCNKTFARKYNLNIHVKSVHYSQDSLDKYQCSLCEFSSIFKTNLMRHEKKVHADGKNYIARKTKQICTCSICNAKFTSLSTLRNHERKKHSLYNKVCKDNRKCPICLFVSSPRDKTRIYKHFETDHGIQMTWTNYSFNCIEDFYKWKLEIEQKTTSSFVKYFCGKSSTTYRCHRSGQFKSKGTNKRKTKKSGSCKINAFCPATIRVKSNDSNVEVMYQSTHIGHINEVKHIKLSAEEKEVVRNQIAGEVQIEDDLKLVPVSIAKDDLRLMFRAKNEEIDNIKESINLEEEIEKYPINPKTIQAWIDSVRFSNDTELLMFKPHGVIDLSNTFLNKDCFCLVFITKAQKSILQMYGSDTVIIEYTQSGNIHFCSLLVLDESREAFPTAFMFTDKLDEDTLTLFLEKLKCSVGQINTDVFISGTEHESYSAWIKVMGPPKSRLYLISSVLAEWKSHLDFVYQKDKSDSIYTMLEALMYDLDIDNFEKSLVETLNFLQTDIDTKIFLHYFEENFINNEKYKCWAFCYWVSIGVNPNLSFNNYNWLLTFLNLQGQIIKPLKLTLCAVLNLLKDKLIYLMIKLKKKTFLENLRLLRFRHLESLKFDTSTVMKHEDRWYVSIPKVKGYFVVKRVGSCTHCKQLMCTLCNVCFHEYVCTCKDNVLMKNMCKHIHLVARTLKSEEENESDGENKVLGYVDNEHHLLDEDNGSNTSIRLISFVNNENSLFENADNMMVSDCTIKEDGEIIMNMDFVNNQEIVIEEDYLNTKLDPSFIEQKTEMNHELDMLNMFLQKNVVTNEQVDFVRKEIKQIISTVEAMASP